MTERQDSGWSDEQQNQGGKKMAKMAKFMTNTEEQEDSIGYFLFGKEFQTAGNPVEWR